ncbi:hypothetical protein [Actinophytocola algeriensis]|uniref:GerMN domain-containing protein n=1 Tax=Actinophytocola algeriensis TaxID=1768010 RepID=A0A7W7Q7W0_9PSEU|nr:hypothetical protein [Actinophytocola algeriensis]MBB4908619.1 hypothetical protein [Actinophytocola algeriensis]MBE1474994.1 hypothetical protein [Actinophytocola algeriensis]
MKWVCAVAAVLLLAGCGVQSSGVGDSGAAPTGVAPGVTLYFVDRQERLRPQLRETGRLGSIAEAMSLLLTGVGDSDLRTEIAATGTTHVVVTSAPGLVQLMVPVTIDDVTPLGIDQIVCTALGVHVQSGGSRDTEVQVRFIQPTEESDKRRTCPLTG